MPKLKYKLKLEYFLFQFSIPIGATNSRQRNSRLHMQFIICVLYIAARFHTFLSLKYGQKLIVRESAFGVTVIIRP